MLQPPKKLSTSLVLRWFMQGSWRHMGLNVTTSLGVSLLATLLGWLIWSNFKTLGPWLGFFCGFMLFWLVMGLCFFASAWVSARVHEDIKQAPLPALSPQRLITLTGQFVFACLNWSMGGLLGWLPSMILTIIWFVPVPITLVEGAPLMESIKRSQELTSDQIGPMMIFAFIFTLLELFLMPLTTLICCLPLIGLHLQGALSQEHAWLGAGAILAFWMTFYINLKGVLEAVVYEALIHQRSTDELLDIFA